MTYESLKDMYDIIDEILTLKEDKANLLEFQSKLVDSDSKVVVSFNFENPNPTETVINYDEAPISILSNLFESSSTAGKIGNSDIMTFTQSELTSRACIAMISSVIRYNDSLIKDRIEQIKKIKIDEGTTNTI